MSSLSESMSVSEEEFDAYATQKSHSQNFFNISLILSIVSTLITVSHDLNFTPEKIAIIVVGACSIFLQCVVGTMLVILAAHDKDQIFCTSAKVLNVLVTLFSATFPIFAGIMLILRMTIMG